MATNLTKSLDEFAIKRIKCLLNINETMQMFGSMDGFTNTCHDDRKSKFLQILVLGKKPMGP